MSGDSDNSSRSGSAAGSADAAAASSASRQADELRRAAHLKLIRAMPMSQYLSTQTAEVLAAAVVMSPAALLLFTVNGVLAARFPRAAPLGMPTPPIPQTFGGLFAAGLRAGAGSTLRLAMWSAGTAFASALTREVAKVGPRHAALPPPAVDGVSGAGTGGGGSTGAREAMWINAAAGGAVAFAVLGATPGMTPPRRLLYATMGSMGGVMLPQMMALAGPAVRKQLTQMLGGGGEGVR